MLASATSGNGANGAAIAWAVTVSLAGFVGYWTPVLVALIRHVPNKAQVFVIDLLLGWTVIGWIVALVMALKPLPPPYPPPYGPGYGGQG